MRACVCVRQVIEDLAIDSPHVAKHLAQVVGGLAAAGTLQLAELQARARSLCGRGGGGGLFGLLSLLLSARAQAACVGLDNFSVLVNSGTGAKFITAVCPCRLRDRGLRDWLECLIDCCVCVWGSHASRQVIAEFERVAPGRRAEGVDVAVWSRRVRAAARAAARDHARCAHSHGHVCAVRRTCWRRRATRWRHVWDFPRCAFLSCCGQKWT